MNAIGKTVFTLLVGTVIGFVSGYIYSNKVNSDKFEQELKDYKEEYERDHNPNPEEKPEEKDIPESVINSVKEMQSVVSQKREKAQKAYNNILKKEGYSDMNLEESNNPNPFIIPPEKFFTDEPPKGYHRLTVFYDSESGAVYDEGGDYAWEDDDEFGMDNLHKFDEAPITELYVQNDVSKTQYEIVLEDPSTIS